jgi:hypothetical protein
MMVCHTVVLVHIFVYYIGYIKGWIGKHSSNDFVIKAAFDQRWLSYICITANTTESYIHSRFSITMNVFSTMTIQSCQ